jgi:hypothetical protein
MIYLVVTGIKASDAAVFSIHRHLIWLGIADWGRRTSSDIDIRRKKSCTVRQTHQHQHLCRPLNHLRPLEFVVLCAGHVYHSYENHNGPGRHG